MARGGKRGNSEGSIYQRADGRWAASVSVGYGADGKRQRKTLYGATRKEVASKLTALQQNVADGLPPGNDQVTVAHLMTAWLTDVAAPTVRPKTYQSYAFLVKSHIIPALGRERLSKVDARRIQAFLTERQESGLSPRTAQYLRAVLRRAFQQAVKWDWVSRNVVTLTEPPRMEKPESPTFTPAQAHALLSAFSGYRHEALFTVFMGLGLRLGEALGLRWEDVSLTPEGSGGTVTVRFQLQQINGEFRLTAPKSRTSRRTVSLPSFVAKSLLAHRARQEEMIPVWEQVGEQNPWGLVFTNTLGGPLGERNVRRDFYAVLAKAGIARIRLHDLRHLCASLLIAQQVHPRVIMEILGHSQISLTMNTYGHLMPGATQAAANALDDLISGAKE